MGDSIAVFSFGFIIGFIMGLIFGLIFLATSHTALDLCKTQFKGDLIDGRCVKVEIKEIK